MNNKNPELHIVEPIQWKEDHIRIIDQTFLPGREIYQDIFEVGKVWEAIRSLRVRGAPAIGIAAAYGVYLGAKDLPEIEIVDLHSEIQRICEYLSSARPTAVNLQWALDQALSLSDSMQGEPAEKITSALLDLARDLHENDKQICADIGIAGQELIPDNAAIITHCNTGSLATGKYGTALSVIYHAHLKGKKIHVWVDETRPLLQGSRLTAWELEKTGIDYHIIADSMAGWVMKSSKADLVIVGTDRVAANGDVANKIGTYSLAVLAKHHGIPFYVAAPKSSIDLNTPTGDDIPIEERQDDELRVIGDQVTAPEKAPVYNPAFDITPHELVDAFITEKGIIRPDYTASLKQI